MLATAVMKKGIVLTVSNFRKSFLLADFFMKSLVRSILMYQRIDN